MKQTGIPPINQEETTQFLYKLDCTKTTMTRQQFSDALVLAKSKMEFDLVDDSSLHGCGLPGFKPVVVTLEMVAKLLRWQCLQLNGQWDSEALQDCREISKKRFLVV